REKGERERERGRENGRGGAGGGGGVDGGEEPAGERGGGGGGDGGAGLRHAVRLGGAGGGEEEGFGRGGGGHGGGRWWRRRRRRRRGAEDVGRGRGAGLLGGQANRARGRVLPMLQVRQEHAESQSWILLPSGKDNTLTIICPYSSISTCTFSLKRFWSKTALEVNM
ncbi:Os07g0553900, partial [Oryza sativa Japonica Group]